MSLDVIHRSFTLERTYPTSPARVFHALSDPAKKRRWYVEGDGFVVDSYTLDFRVGGFERSRFRFGDGPPVTNDCVFLDIAPDERLVFAYAMTVDGAPMSSSLGTVELRAAKGGTRLKYTEHTAYVDGKDGGDARREGTVGLLDRLGRELDAHP
jgi:uncharacterized protein YndB with AHSA1/START domain